VAKASYFDVAANLKNTKLLAERLNEAFKTGSTARIVEAIGTLARVKGMYDIASETGMDPVTLYRSVKRADIKLSTAMKLLTSFNVRLVVVPKRK
jgi:probable addiction module antidote protein